MAQFGVGEDAVEFFERQREQQEKWVSGADGKRFKPVAAFAGTVRAQLRQQTSSAVISGKKKKKKKVKNRSTTATIHTHQDKVGEEIRMLTAGQSPTQTKALTVATAPTDANSNENERWELLMAESPSQRRAKERLVKTSGSKNRADVTKVKVLRRYNLQLRRYFKRFAIKVRLMLLFCHRCDSRISGGTFVILCLV